MGRHRTSQKVQGLPTSVSAPAFAVASPLLSSHEEWFDDGNWTDVSPTAEATTPTAAEAFDALCDSSATRRRRRSVDEEGRSGVAALPLRKKKVCTFTSGRWRCIWYVACCCW